MDIAVRNVKWWDDNTTETVRLACLERNLEVLSCLPTGEPNEVLVTVKGPAESVDAFVEDVSNGDADPIETETRDLDDSEYQLWLADALAKIGVEYEPKEIPADEAEDAEA